MRKLFLAVAVVSMGFFSSCDKCKDKTCENAASCDKKTADCSDVCLNKGTSDASTGACTCTAFYDGKTCDNEVRNDLAGSYNGNLDLGVLGSYGSVIVASNNGTDATSQKFVITTTIGTTKSVIEILGTLTSATEVTLVETEVPFSLVPNNTKAKISGSGVYDGSKLTATIKIVPSTTGGQLGGTFKGVK